MNIEDFAKVAALKAEYEACLGYVRESERRYRGRGERTSIVLELADSDGDFHETCRVPFPASDLLAIVKVRIVELVKQLAALGVTAPDKVR